MLPDPEPAPPAATPPDPDPRGEAVSGQSVPEVEPAADDVVPRRVAGEDPLPTQPDPTLMWVDFF